MTERDEIVLRIKVATLKAAVHGAVSIMSEIEELLRNSSGEVEEEGCRHSNTVAITTMGGVAGHRRMLCRDCDKVIENVGEAIGSAHE